MSVRIQLRSLAALVLASSLAVSGLGQVTVAQAASVKTSSGKTCTIIGTSGSDVLNGKPGNDVICGLGGNDVINALSGDDIVDGGTGNDRIYGGVGNDRIEGGAGNDNIKGDDGNDRILGDAGNDKIYGDKGDDGLIGGDGSDILAGSDGEPAPEEKNLCARDENDQVSYCGFDNAAPWIVSIDMSRSQVDASSSAQKVDLTMRITDGLMGVSPSQSTCGVIHEASRQQTGMGSFSRVSGDAIDGVYKCTVTIPLQGATGRWGLAISTWDTVGNRSEFDQFPDRQAFYGAPILDLKQDFWITNVGLGDNYSPRIIEPKISATSIDTSTSDKSISVNMNITDDLSGVVGANCSVGHKQIEFLDGKYGRGDAKQISGTNTNGVWSCTMLLPKNAGQGKWIVNLRSWDKTGKSYSLASSPTNPNQWVVDDIQSWHVPAPITSKEINYFTQTAPGDDTPPVLQSIAITPTTIDASSKDQTITATVSFGPDKWAGNGFMMIMLYEPTMAQINFTCSKSQATSGGPAVFTCLGTIKRGSAKGTYQTMLLVHDLIGNRGDYRGNLCTGHWEDGPAGVDFGKVGPIGVYNGAGVPGPNSGTNCAPN